MCFRWAGFCCVTGRQLFTDTPALNSRFVPEKVLSSGLQHLWGHLMTKQAYSWSSTNSTFSVTSQRSLSNEAVTVSPNASLSWRLSFHPPVMHSSPSGESRLDWASHRVHAASNTDQTCLRVKPLWYFIDAHSSGLLVKSNKLCEIRTVRRRRMISASVYTRSRFTVFLAHRAASACFFTQ